MHEIVNFLVSTIGSLGYFGIFALMFLESSFFPFPSEVVMIPAGYLAFKGDMNLTLVILSGVAGSLAGAWLNYILALKFGRKFILKIISNEKIDLLENFFKKHGHISTFTGRLIPGIRQYISFPAGLAKMNGIEFSIYTTLGAAIWATILTLLGYFIGANQELVTTYLKQITIVTLILLSILVFWYYKRSKKLS
jgi:membrane protein DedA with SNARE-associated domain